MAKRKLGYRLPDELWVRLEPLVPARKSAHPLGGGRPRRADRDCADAIFFVLRTGCQWEALDATGLCPHRTAHDRFQEWVAAGVWRKLWQALVREYDELVGLDWSYLSVDGSLTKAPLAALGEKGGPNPTDRGKRGVKRSVATAAAGVPVGVTVAGANRNDHLLLAETLAKLVVRRPRPTPARPQGLCLDKGYELREHACGRTPATPAPAPAHPRRGGPGQTPRPPSPALGRRARPLLAQPLPPPPRPPGEEGRQLRGHAPPRLRHHHRRPNGVIRIGS